MLKPSILVNPKYATNNIDTHKAGWYQIQPNNSNIALRVSNTNIGLSGEIRLNTTESPYVFQGNTGSGWVNFNSTTGPMGPSGKDFTKSVNFNNLSSNTSLGTTVELGNIFATTYANVESNISNVNIRSIQGSTYTINSNLTVNSIILKQNSNVITIHSEPIPYKWDFTGSQNTVSYLKNSSNISDISYGSGYGEISKWIVKSDTNVYRGQAVKLTKDINTNNIVITPITYTTLTNINIFTTPFNMLGIATEDAYGGNTCNVCTKGITTIKCTDQTTTDFIRSNDISNIGIPGLVGKDGFIFNNTQSQIPVIYINAGYFLESGLGISSNGNYSLFYVNPVVQLY
jgi:hypothetical protein